MVFHRYSAILVHIPKTGGQSIKELLGRDEDNVTAFPGLDCPDLGDTSAGSLHAHMAAREMAAHDAHGYFTRYFCFTFVRNPFDRVVSEYAWRKSRYPHRIAFDTFDAFVHAIRDGWNYESDDARHLASQSSMICDDAGNILVDFVGRYESFSADLAALLARLNVPQRLLHRNPSRRSHYADYYTPATRSIVESLYADDLARFDYHYETRAS